MKDDRGILKNLAIRILHHQDFQVAGLRRRLVLAAMALRLRRGKRKGETQKSSNGEKQQARQHSAILPPYLRACPAALLATRA